MSLICRLVSITLLTFVSSSAFGQSKIMLMPVVPVGDVVSQDTADQMYRALREELEGRSGVLVLDGRYKASSKRGAARRGRSRNAALTLEQALDRLDEGRRQSQKLRFARALKPLGDALRIFEENIAKLTDYRPLVDAHLLLAEAYLRRGKQRDGVEVVEKLLTLFPALELDPKKYPPMFLTLVKQSRKKVAAKARGVLRVARGGDREQVFLNGKAVGRTPLRVDAVVPGVHYVRVTGAGGAVWGRKVTVPAGGEVVAEDPVKSTVTFKGGAKDTIGRNVFNRSVQDSVRTAARKRGADFVIVTGLGAKMGLLSCAGFLGDVRKRTWSRIRTVSPDMDLLSAGIEASSYMSSVTGLMKSPGPGVRGALTEFVEGVASPNSVGRGFVEKRATFVTEEAIAAAIKASAPRRVTPVVVAKPELDPAQGQPVKVELLPEEAFAEKIGLTKIDLDGSAVGDEGGVLSKWWFWTSVGATTAAIVAALLVTSEGEPTGVMVRASW